jgi:hypothetical protein
VRDDQAVVVGRVEDVEPARLDDEQVELRVAHAKDDVAIAIPALGRVRAERVHLGVVELGECRVGYIGQHGNRLAPAAGRMDCVDKSRRPRRPEPVKV